MSRHTIEMHKKRSYKARKLFTAVAIAAAALVGEAAHAAPPAKPSALARSFGANGPVSKPRKPTKRKETKRPKPIKPGPLMLGMYTPTKPSAFDVHSSAVV